MRLKSLVGALFKARARGEMETEITGIAFDSRKVEKGFLFIAIKGVKTDGHKYIDAAMENGAAAIVVEDDPGIHSIPVIIVEDARKALAEAAAKFYDYPADKLKVIGVTGTNGKTTVTHMIASILEAHGVKTGIVGTLYIKIGERLLPARVTTPESLEIQDYLSQMVDSGIEAVVMEVSSHALHFERVAGIIFDAAVFTNLTQDHLDFHENIEEYFEQKKKLFTRLKPAEEGGTAILNADDLKTPEIIKVLDRPYTTYGIYRKCDLRAKEIKTGINGTRFIAEGERWDIPVRMNMAGEFNIYNALSAIGVALAMNIPPAHISRGLENMTGVRGRFELVDYGQPFGVVVDYAHTPDGLDNLLNSARRLVENRLIVVFGCGGDRDRTKRPMMGQIAAELADHVIITSDNPRTEDPKAIISDIQVGVEKERKDYEVEVDRKTAIIRAINTAVPGDLVVIAGKGHETYQIFKDKTIHFDDAEVAREALASLASETAE